MGERAEPVDPAPSNGPVDPGGTGVAASGKSSAAPVRVVLLAFDHHVPERVRNYVVNLLAEGVEVDLAMLDTDAWAEPEPEQWAEVSRHPRLRVYTLDGAERRHPVRRVHNRVLTPFYRMNRPRLLARTFHKRLAEVDFTEVDRVVAADLYGVTLGWQLARRYPHLVATMQLDLNLHERHRSTG
ncbi:hypothetical protein ACFP2T_35925 [Plantactinospora solaniradicis]|uniref:Glycosyltransferase family 1 protein n=1 Tax=Plantactinospora solaniradicis TaxID=1723736 RepID=A0ABW1KJ98_9ACTN